jgi:hypothetical protein
MKHWLYLTIVVLLGLSTRAGAADFSIVSLEAKVFANKVEEWPPSPGDSVRITCSWKRTLAVGESVPKAFSSARGRILVDGKPLSNYGKDDFHMMGSGQYISWPAVAGTHRIRCELDPDNTAAETNETNNRKEIVIDVPGKVRAAGAGPQTALTGAILPGGKSKTCKATIYTTVQLDKMQFSALEGVPDANPAKMTLDLIGSHGLGNNVHCEYQNVGKDVKLVYTFQCANAHSSGPKHIYACD